MHVEYLMGNEAIAMGADAVAVAWLQLLLPLRS